MKVKCTILFLLILLAVLIITACMPKADYEATTIYTPHGTAVSAFRVLNELSSADYNEIMDYTHDYFPNAVYIRYPTAYYNCHSYAWYSKNSTNRIWIQSPEQEKFWTDYSYLYYATYNNGGIPNTTDPLSVDYYNDDHSAFKYAGTVTYFYSKWGNGGLMKHTPGYCPYDDSVLKYYALNTIW
jgi:hypothetical protein